MLGSVSTLVSFATVETPIGSMHVASTPAGIAAISREPAAERFLERLQRRFPEAHFVPDADGVRDAAAWLLGYFAGARLDLATVDLSGLTRFDRRVFEAVRAIPYGRVETYGDVAMAIGSPRAARAVGRALSRCPLFPAVPCHRVVLGADGFSGWGGGDIGLKRRLIDLERGR